MEQLKELKQRLEQTRPVAWEELPDISLYKDQVIGYMPRQLIQYREEESLTSAMVNNYIKGGYLPRAEGKRYNREHLARLTELCTLKQVLSVGDAGALLQAQRGAGAAEDYAFFCRELDTALTETAQRLEETCPQEELAQLALSLALRSYADRLACQRILDLLRGEEPAREKKTRKNRKDG